MYCVSTDVTSIFLFIDKHKYLWIRMYFPSLVTYSYEILSSKPLATNQPSGFLIVFFCISFTSSTWLSKTCKCWCTDLLRPSAWEVICFRQIRKNSKEEFMSFNTNINHIRTSRKNLPLTLHWKTITHILTQVNTSLKFPLKKISWAAF